jgi:hypothetical protein
MSEASPLLSCRYSTCLVGLRQSLASCVGEIRSSPKGQMIFSRLWAGDDSDTAAKLNDPKPLTKEEQNALVQVHNKQQRCRQIVIAHDNRRPIARGALGYGETTARLSPVSQQKQYDGSTALKDAQRERFCQAVLELNSLHKAYELAGFKRPRGKG